MTEEFKGNKPETKMSPEEFEKMLENFKIEFDKKFAELKKEYDRIFKGDRPQG